MENSYTDRISTVINIELADKCKDEPSVSTDSDSMLSARLSDTALNIIENEQPPTCSISANDCKSYQQIDSLGHLHNEQKSFTERHSELRLHPNPIFVNSSLSVRDNASADVSSVNTVVMGNCSKSIKSSFNLHSLNKGDENKLSGVVKMKPPIIKKKVSPVKKSNSQVRKSSRSSPVSVPNRSSNGSKKSGVNLKQCPPISNCKVSQDNCAYTKVGKCKLKQKFVSTFNKMNSQHSAQCIKRGQVECDFVCNLYKSDNWIKSYFANYDKISKQQSEQNERGNARVVVRKVSGSSNHRNILLRGGKMNGSVAEQCICSFCERKLGWEGMTCLKLDVPLPSSIMYPTSLLRHYGIFFSVPLCGSSGKNSLVNICQVCYDLVLDGDAVYQKVQHITSQMRTLWHKQVLVREESSPSLCKSLNSFNGSPLHFSTELDAGQKESVISTTKGKRIICGKKLPYILPRSSTDMMSPGSSLNVSSAPSKVSLRGTTKIECENGKPRKMRSKPLTCGLCGTDFYLEDKWEHHLENHHRVQLKWRRFTPNMHSKLKARIINELTKIDDHQDSNSKSSKNIPHTCTACESTFNGKSSFVMHLHNYHNMVVDDELLIMIEDHSADKTLCKKDKIFPSQSDGIRILGNNHTKSDLNCADNDCKTKSFSEVGDDEMLPLDDYGNNNMTAGDEVLDSTYCQNVKDSHNSEDISSENLSVTNIIDRKMEDPVCDDSMVSGVTCMICNKNFKLKNELENHLETAHLLSVVLKGDGSGGVLDYVVDVQENEKLVKKIGGETDLVSQETVNKASELVEWQSNNVLNNPFLSENKQTIEKGNFDEMGVPQCLVYECEICGRRVLGKKLLRNHLRRVHNITVNLQEDHPQTYRYCKLCLFRTTTRALLRKHRREKHGICKGIDQQQCETCGKMYSSVYIQEHMAVIHGNERKHTCELCGMKFFDKKGVKSHIYFEHANKEWKCENCTLTFKKYHQLRQHIIYVHSTKEFKCDRCSKVFKRKGDLTTHTKRMHEKNVIVCSYCSRQYKNGTKYRNHLVNIHGLSKEETYSHRYARHKRANNKLQSKSEKVSDVQSEKVLKNPADSDVQNTCIRIEKAEPEFQLMEVMEATNNDSEEVTVLILS